MRFQDQFFHFKFRPFNVNLSEKKFSKKNQKTFFVFQGKENWHCIVPRCSVTFWTHPEIFEKNQKTFFVLLGKRTGTVLSRYVESLFGPTRKSSPWGNFSDGGLNQSIKRRLSLLTFGWLIDWLTISWLWLDWFIGFVPHDVFTGAGLKWPNTVGQYSNRTGRGKSTWLPPKFPRLEPWKTLKSMESSLPSGSSWRCRKQSRGTHWRGRWRGGTWRNRSARKWLPSRPSASWPRIS